MEQQSTHCDILRSHGIKHAAQVPAVEDERLVWTGSFDRPHIPKCKPSAEMVYSLYSRHVQSTHWGIVALVALTQTIETRPRAEFRFNLGDPHPKPQCFSQLRDVLHIHPGVLGGSRSRILEITVSRMSPRLEAPEIPETTHTTA